MTGTGRILYVEPSVDCARDIAEQLSPRLSTLVHRKIYGTPDLAQALREENWDAVVCCSSLPATGTLHSFFTNLPGMACQIKLDTDGTLSFPYVSEGCFALLSIAPVKIQMQGYLMLAMLHHEDRAAFYKSMRESVALSAAWNWEGRIVMPHQNEIKWVNLRATHRESGRGGTIWEGIVINITQNKLAEQEIKTSHMRLREMFANMEHIKEQERVRIAHEIHDEMGMLLTALKMDLFWLAQHLPTDDHELHEKSKTMLDMLDKAGSVANNLVHDLRPGFLDCFGIIASIEVDAKEFTNRTGVICTITKSDESIDLTIEQSIALLRVFHEALNNIMKHAMAEQVQIKFTQTEKFVEMIVSDNGKGFDESSRNKPRSFGFLGIRERIHHLGGKVSITSEPGKGTQISVSLPRDSTGHPDNLSETQQALF